MIRRDYILRAIQEMVQTLARVVFLKSRREYEQALSEINQALRQTGAEEREQETMSVEQWIALCRKHEASATGLMVATADLLREQGEVFALQEKSAESHRSRVTSLALMLEALLAGDTFVSEALLNKVEQLIDQTNDAPRPSALWHRIVRYFEARERFGLAEDALFTWVDTGDSIAVREGLLFYERLLARSDTDLQRGELPRPEVEQGREELAARYKAGTDARIT
jgi:hypothetical protein